LLINPLGRQEKSNASIGLLGFLSTMDDGYMIILFNPDPGMEFPFDSLEVFREIVESVLEVGINEIILQYPSKRKGMPLFERVAAEVLPKLRA
jgi:hypothetical protein